MNFKEFDDVILSEEEMLNLMYKWKNILKLNAWKIKLRMCTEEEMPLDNVQGCCEVYEPIRSACIYIPINRPSCVTYGFNMEQTLIHEMLHIKLNFFAPKQSKKEKYLVYEQEVDSLATILYNLDKKDEMDDTKKSETGGRKNSTGKGRKRTEE